MKKFLLPALFFVSLFLFACAEIQTPPGNADMPQATAAADCEAPQTWSLTYTRSGGFAGTMDTMTLDSEGNIVTSGRSDNLVVEGSIPPADVENIETLLVATCPFEGIALASCADCFNYDVEVTMDGNYYQFETNDAGLMESNASSLIGALESVMERAQNGEF